MSTAITYGTEAWLASLAEAGYDLTVSENRAPARRITLRVVSDDLEPLELSAPERVCVGVLARKDGVGAFVPCPSEADARELLGRVMAEAEWM